ncbi:MAG TPA: 30S ribosomal protein S4 [Patescibacteria group bacterium]|nr:30S ribosomal protein S4 [Patescibacteria group bacterium]
MSKKYPKCKICRRAGKKLFLRGERCYTSKCAMKKRNFPPGQHGTKGFPRSSEYGRQLREKQALNKFYHLREKQFKNYFEKAKQIGENTETWFLRFLEKRLDNVVFRAGFSKARLQARQLVSHGHVLVNGRKMDISSYQVEVGDTISIKDKKEIQQLVKDRLAERNKDQKLPKWIDVDKKKLEIKILQEPSEEDLPQEFETKMIIAYYSR